MVLQAVTILKILNCLFIMVKFFGNWTFRTNDFSHKSSGTSFGLFAQVLDCLHNSWGSFCTIIIREKHQYKRYTD